MTPSKVDLIFYGGPASGKTTQVERIAKKYSANPIFVGERLREIAKSKTPLGIAVASRIDNGKLVSHKLLIELIRKWVEATPDHQMIISDGAPRDISETRMYDRILRSHGRSAVAVYLKLPISVAKERIVTRAKKEKRIDDINQKAVTERIKLFHAESKNILDYYKAKGRLLVIDANQSIPKVTADIITKLKSWS